ncbi:MAG: tol-pal system protein YbgF [Paludibacterium sp.]|uniref:tol-pal system protein YbgF n=1 Tax=Paludibacterium sp. TaxID=1917523 RepID=UPI0025F3FC40|nr:tol-pal system protein YbgF [Paludibacterium sp.]MBV8046019.1 tol-pal system protein YbgF [Paludibacterium sp.]MBV8647774.1 tol-pal system protein YbgF [Paludibacterium sp.]
MKRLAMGCALLALVSGCATNADLENTRQQIDQVNQQASARLTQIETKLSNDKLLDMVSQLDELRAKVDKLSGEVEVLNYNLQSAQKRQNDLYADLDARLAKLEGGPGNAPTASSAPAASSPAASGSAQAVPDFDRALNLLRQRDFAAAITALDQYVKQNPKDPQAADALFWQGVAHTALKQYDAAIAIHRQFADQYPNHPKAPDALRNIASCQIELSQNDEAKVTLKRLIKLYPKSAAAAKAKLMLKKL